MTKKKPAKPPADSPHNGENNVPDACDADLPPEIEAAEAALRRAEAELQKAKRKYCRIRRRAAEKLKRARKTTGTDLVNSTLQLVKKHPAPGVLIAAAIGFFLGRLFRR